VDWCGYNDTNPPRDDGSRSERFGAVLTLGHGNDRRDQGRGRHRRRGGVDGRREPCRRPDGPRWRLSPRTEVRSLRQANRAGALGAARTCYGHLAGRLGVGITDALVDRRLVEREGEVFLLTDPGAAFLTDLGIERPPRAGKACNDWSERRPHLAGKLGVTLTKRLFDLDWVRRTERRRAVEVTDEGKRELNVRLGI
jgi:hypothetical protein